MSRTDDLERLAMDAILLLLEAQPDPDKSDFPDEWQEAVENWREDYDKLFPPFDILSPRRLRTEEPR